MRLEIIVACGQETYMDKGPLVGSWKLLSSEYVSEDGEVIYPMSEQVMGRLVYDDRGFMSVHHMRANRPAFASGDLTDGTTEEIKAAFESYRGYYGTYEVDRDKKVIIHHVEGSSAPNWTGKDNERFFELSGNRLVLTTKPMLVGGKMRSAKLVWERL
jgi:hypothetical protein